jgi:raffinose/stachyose/melibiose transport system substrate-binding protein
MTWLVSNEEASAALVEQLGVMPFKNAAASKNGFLNNATTLSGLQYYVMDWAARYQPDKDNYRAELTEALKAYNEDQTDEKWNKVKTAFVDGWAKHYKAEHE